MGIQYGIPDGATLSQAVRMVARHPRNAKFQRLAAAQVNQAQACWIQALAIDWEQLTGERHESWPEAIKAVGSAAAEPIRRLREICQQMEDPEQVIDYWTPGARDGDWLTDLPYVRRCQGCRRFFYLSDVRRTHCNSCRAKAERDKKRRQRGTDLSSRPCSHCGATFTPKRSTAQFCSTRCRVAAHRANASI